MALRADLAELPLYVIRTHCPLVVRLMTRVAGHRRSLILPVHVALSAGCVDVRSGQWEIGQVVIERCRIPGIHRMALQAVVTEQIRHMVGVSHSLKIRLMAGVALRWRPALILSIRVTLGTVHGDVRARQRERCTVVVERGRIPMTGTVTLLTSVWKLVRSMAGIGGAVVVGLVARPAIGGCAVVLAICVALSTRQQDMGAGKRELRQVVVKRCRGPCRRRVALRARMIVISRDMIWVSDGLIVCLMAAVAIRRQILVLSARVAGGAVGAHMRAG